MSVRRRQRGDADILGGRHRRADRAERVVRRTADHRGGAEADRRRIRRDAFGAGAGGGADLHRRRLRRHRDGLAGRADRRARGGDVRRHDDRHRPDHFVAGRTDAALHQQLPVGRAARRRRHVRAADDLCQPLVRRPPRHRDRADLGRPVRRRVRCGRRCSSWASIPSAGATPCWSMPCSSSS